MGMYITEHPINLASFLTQPPDPSSGGVASFVGVVRNHHEGKDVLRLFYEAYSAMAEKVMGEIIAEVIAKTGARAIRAIHRTGWLEIGDAAVAIVAEAPHRAEAFAACRATIDEIKHRLPVWKKELYTDGSDAWVRCHHPGEQHCEAKDGEHHHHR